MKNLDFFWKMSPNTVQRPQVSKILNFLITKPLNWNLMKKSLNDNRSQKESKIGNFLFRTISRELYDLQNVFSSTFTYSQ